MLTNDQSLISAVHNSDLEKIDKLLLDGADVNATDFRGKTILSIALEKNNIEILILLFEKGINLYIDNKSGEDAFFLAACYNSVKIIILLLQKGININIVNEEGRNALFYAIQHNNIEVVKILLENDIDIIIVDKFKRDAISYNIDSNGSLKIKDEEFVNLSESYIKIKYEIFKLLISYGVDKSINILMISIFNTNSRISNGNSNFNYYDSIEETNNGYLKEITRLELIDHKIRRGKDKNITDYDHDCFVGRYLNYLNKEEIKLSPNASAQVFDQIFAILQSSAFDVTSATLITLVEQKFNARFEKLGNEEMINKLVKVYYNYKFSQNITQFLRGEITLNDQQIKILTQQIFHINLDIIKTHINELLESGYAVILEPMLKLALPTSFKIKLVTAFIEYNKKYDQEEKYTVDIDDYNSTMDELMEAIGIIPHEYKTAAELI